MIRREPVINADDDLVRPDLPPARDQEDEDEDHDYRRRDRFDVRGGQFSRDEKHLRILSILYYVGGGGLGVIGGLFPLWLVVLGVAGFNDPPSTGAAIFPSGPGLACAFIVIGSVATLLVWTMAACPLFAGYNLSRKKHYRFCFNFACICCALIPLGTILGIFTIVILARPSVKELFDGYSFRFWR